MEYISLTCQIIFKILNFMYKILFFINNILLLFLMLLADGFEAVEASVFTDVLGWNK